MYVCMWKPVCDLISVQKYEIKHCSIIFPCGLLFNVLFPCRISNINFVGAEIYQKRYATYVDLICLQKLCGLAFIDRYCIYTTGTL